MILSYLRAWRENGWTPIDATAYAKAWHQFGGSVASHPDVVERLAGLAGLPVRYLGWFVAGELRAAIPTWGRYLALSKDVLKREGGTGGHGTLQEELNAALVGMLHLARSGRMPDLDDSLAHLLISGPAELCTRLYGLPSGGVDEGSIADLVVYDAIPAADPETGYSPFLLGQLVPSRDG